MKSTKFPELRVKIKSLAAEARIIRAEEALHPRSSRERQSLSHHRREIVAREQRAALVALAFVRGVPYAAVERKPRCNRCPFDRPGPDWNRVSKLADRYGQTNLAERPLWEAIVVWRSAVACELKEPPAPVVRPTVGAVSRRAVRVVRGVRAAAS
jgi:hypothetical protein